MSTNENVPPSENAQGAHYGDACGICGGPCVVGSKGLYCPKCQPNKALNEVGIVATGIPEAEQPEALAFAVTSTDIEESMEQSRDVRIRADSPRTYETGYLDGYVDGVMVTQDLEPVSPPPRAEINTTAPVESEEELWDEMVGRCMEFTSFNYALAQKLYVITRKTVEP